MALGGGGVRLTELLRARALQCQQVLNEVDFPPLTDIHELLIALKIRRHYKGSFQLTKPGRTLVGRRDRLFSIVTPS